MNHHWMKKNNKLCSKLLMKEITDAEYNHKKKDFGKI